MRKTLRLLPRSSSSELMKQAAICKTLRFFNLDLKRLVGFGTDGCSTMLGKDTGVARRLKELSPSLISFHCPAHRLQLAILDICKDVSLSRLNKVNSSMTLYKKRRRFSKLFTNFINTLPSEGAPLKNERNYRTRRNLQKCVQKERYVC
jgi:hypothetical protein